MIKVAVIGASGYTGVELLRLLVNHPEVELCVITSRQYAGEHIATVFPSLGGIVDMVCEELDVARIGAVADVVFTALPHKSAMEVVPGFLAAGCKVVDLSADYRLRDVAVYEHWYQQHANPYLLEQAVYGLPELYREQIKGAQLVANPGCYPTSAAVALAPLLHHKLIDHRSLVIDSKSAASGAGRAAKTASLFCEVNEGFKAYGVANHRHTPEIEQTLSEVAGEKVIVNFTPHLLPINRGILTTCYANMAGTTPQDELYALYRDFYAGCQFVRLPGAGELPNVAYVRGSNYVDVGLVADERTGRIIAISAIDNLVKGAAGQAVQNMNLMCAIAENSGLHVVPCCP